MLLAGALALNHTGTYDLVKSFFGTTPRSISSSSPNVTRLDVEP
jgi:hypothetical protein